MQAMIRVQHLFLNPHELNSVLHIKTWWEKERIKKNAETAKLTGSRGSHIQFALPENIT